MTRARGIGGQAAEGWGSLKSVCEMLVLLLTAAEASVAMPNIFISGLQWASFHSRGREWKYQTGQPLCLLNSTAKITVSDLCTSPLATQALLGAQYNFKCSGSSCVIQQTEYEAVHNKLQLPEQTEGQAATTKAPQVMQREHSACLGEANHWKLSSDQCHMSSSLLTSHSQQKACPPSLL